MTRRKRRLLIILVAGIVVLLAAFGWVYYHVFLSTSAAIQRAEGDLFRRMQVTQVDDEGTYRFFFATNRREVNNNDDIENRFSNEREDSLKFGYFDSSIDPNLGLGIIFNPDLWFQTEQTRIRRVRREAGGLRAGVAEAFPAHGRARFPRTVSRSTAQDRVSRTSARHRHTGAGVRLAG